MGYFSSGTEGEIYYERYCENCIHSSDNPEVWECPIWDAHLLYSDKLCDTKDEPGKVMLDMFIPIDESGHNEECKMFVEKPKQQVELEDWQQPGLF